MKRHRDALSAQGGACNSLPLAVALADAIKAARTEHGGDMSKADRDPAVRLIAHQIAHLLNLGELDMCREYTAAVDACEAATVADVERAQRIMSDEAGHFRCEG